MPAESNPTNEEAADALITSSTAARAGLVAGGVARPCLGDGGIRSDTEGSEQEPKPTAVVAEESSPEAEDNDKGAN